MNSDSISTPPGILTLPADCRLKIILAAVSYTSKNRPTLRACLLLCKDFYKIMVANWPRIVKHYTIKIELPKCIQYTFCELRHRANDLPAVVWADGTRCWCRYDKVHRDNDMPAIIYSSGTRMWYQHGKIHRDNVLSENGTEPHGLPSVIFANGSRYWYRYGKLYHSQNIPPT